MKERVVIGVILILLLSVSITGCMKKGEDGDDEGSVPYPVTGDGGWVMPENSPVSLFFYPGAFTGTKDITVRKISDVPDEEGIVKDLAFDLGPDGTRFDVPVELSINYSGVDLPDGIEEYMLRIFKIEGDGFAFIANSEVDIEKKVVKAKIDSFSKYVAMGKDYGIIVTNNKDRIAADDKDEVKIQCLLKHLKKGDLSVPTGDPKAKVQIKFELQSFDETGKPYAEPEKFYEITNEYGYATFSAYGMSKLPARYGVAKVSFYNYMSCMVRVDIGFEWPYANDFNESLVGDEWSRYEVVMDGQDRTYIGPKPLSITTSPNGKERFLGPFTTDRIILKLDDIPTHYKIKIEFDFIAIGPWQGSHTDQTWVDILNDPDEEMYIYCTKHVTIQEDHFTGGFDENDIINTLGYDTTPLVFLDQKEEEQTLERGDAIFPIDGTVQNFKSSMDISFNVDQRGFGEVYDQGQFWGIDNVYVRYVAPRSA